MQRYGAMKGSAAFSGLMRSLLAQPEVDDRGEDLEAFLDDLLEGRARAQEVIAVLAALSARPWNVRLTVALARGIERSAVLSESAISEIAALRPFNIVGTGGGTATFNISTTAAIVAAAAGVKVLKSGSTAYSSRAGAVDFLAAAGISPARSTGEVLEGLHRFGIAFYMPGDFAPLLKRFALSAGGLSYRHFATVLNRVGPLLEVLPSAGRLVGVHPPEALPHYEAVFRRMGRMPTWLVSADVGLDEACSFSPNAWIRLSRTGVTRSALEGGDCGFSAASLDDLKGGGPEENVRIARTILSGGGRTGARECVLLNAGMLISLAGLAPDPCSGAAMAREAVSGGKALALFEALARQREAVS